MRSLGRTLRAQALCAQASHGRVHLGEFILSERVMLLPSRSFTCGMCLILGNCSVLCSQKCICNLFLHQVSVVTWKRFLVGCPDNQFYMCACILIPFSCHGGDICWYEMSFAIARDNC